MRMSAQLIGRGLGLTARELNTLLLEHGYLHGLPGNYSLTDKGMQYGFENNHYSDSWTTRTWDDRLVSALAADIAAAADRPSAEPVGVEQDSPVDQNEGDRRRSPWVVAAVVGGSAVAVVGGVIVATNPRVHRWARETIKPRTQKAWRTITGRSRPEPAGDHGVDLAEATAQDEIRPMPGPGETRSGSRNSSEGEQLS